MGRERKGESVRGTWARSGCGSTVSVVSHTALEVSAGRGVGRNVGRCDAMRAPARPRMSE